MDKQVEASVGSFVLGRGELKSPRRAPILGSPARRALLAAMVAVGGSALALSGCTGHLNREDGLFGGDLPDLAGPLPQAAPGADAPSAAPSLTAGLDRTHWSRTTISRERRQVEAQPNYTTLVRYSEACPCDANGGTCSAGPGGTCGVACACGCPCGCGPLSTGRQSSGTAALQGVAAPFHAAFDIVAMPIRLFITPPGSTVRYPESGVGTASSATAPAAMPATDAAPSAPAGTGTDPQPAAGS